MRRGSAPTGDEHGGAQTPPATVLLVLDGTLELRVALVLAPLVND